MSAKKKAAKGSMTAKQIIVAADTLLKTEKQFCTSSTGAPARDKEGKTVMVVSELATQWCLVGALRKVSGDPMLYRPDHPNLAPYVEACTILGGVAQKLFKTRSIISVSDGTGAYKNVKRLLAEGAKVAK